MVSQGIARATGLMLIVFACFAQGGEIFRSTDAQGQVTYTDKPSSRSAVRVAVQTPPVLSDADQARIIAEREAIGEDQAAQAIRAETERQAKALREQTRAAQAAACRRARDRYLMFAEAGRLYRRDEQGRRIYYKSTEIDTERVASKAEMDEWCRP